MNNLPFGERQPVSRRRLLQAASFVALASSKRADGAPLQAPQFTSKRPPVSERRFTSDAVEELLQQTTNTIADSELAWMFSNCFPNTLDTTVQFRDGSKDSLDTFVITGDIDAMWLRDSSAQVWPYLPLASKDKRLARMLQGLIRRQVQCILLDPYANAFMPDPNDAPLSWAAQDSTDKKPGVGERKWEIDSLCYPIRLAHGYWSQTKDVTPFDARWRQAMQSVVHTFREQQRFSGPGPYHFQRKSDTPTESQFSSGFGNPTIPNGMIHSMFRPSDDACLYPLFVPANLFAVHSLRNLATLAQAVGEGAKLANDAELLAAQVEQATKEHGTMRTEAGPVWAYEVDGFGNQLFMDDANAPGLLSLAYLGCCSSSDALYQRTRARVWSKHNPYFFAGTAAEGIGGPHEGLRMIWPMSIIMRALTSSNDGEILQCLHWIKTTHNRTGFIHESFDQDDPAHFTRTWFAWANTLFGELILKLAAERKHLLATKIV